MNKPLVLPKFQLKEISSFAVSDPLGGPSKHLPHFVMAAKDWRGVPVKSSDAPQTPVAWTLDDLAFSIWDYDSSFFPTTTAYMASYTAISPTISWGRPDSIVYKPRTVFIGGFYSKADVVAALAPFSKKLAEKRIVIDLRNTTASGENLPFSVVSLPMSGWDGIEDTYNSGGSPVHVSHFPCTTTPEEWTAGETLYFCFAGYDGSSGGYIPGGDIGARLANLLAAEGDRITGDVPRYDKLGIHLITAYEISGVYSPLVDPGVAFFTAAALADPNHGIDGGETAAGNATNATIGAFQASLAAYNATDPGDIAGLASTAGSAVSAINTTLSAANSWEAAIVATGFLIGTTLDALVNDVISEATIILGDANANHTAATNALPRVADFQANIAEMLAAAAAAAPTVSPLYHGDPVLNEPFPASLLATIMSTEIMPKIISFFGL